MSESEKDRELNELRRLRELGDRALQALIATQMQLDRLLRQAAAQSDPLATELGNLQFMLHKEACKLGELVRQPVDSSNLIQFLRETVERYQRETDISARFISELDKVDMSQRVCRELVNRGWFGFAATELRNMLWYG